MTKRISTMLAAVALTPLAMLVLPTASASAHGYISNPPSRQAQCAQGIVQCGQITWEPQSVEGPKGLRSCSGGNARFAELDDDNKGWVATPVSRSVSFTWTFTAPHRTSNFEYYIGDRKVADFDGGGQQPPNGLTHTIDLSEYSGKQKLLAVWNIYDTANAFYACIDLDIR
ncbi:lytic polysaccharide monooxygenase auxiliary activity family 9 protein [Thermocrispum agreste]|mgnify:CR=1 FL=1|uniref:lytic polysaccharide monooxygenase auxiliary activity family 9 protein n=1 Tax=Thermocrispum agreste TaxID=37925 RepID=UPI000425FF95|nr:lytic polysaccharide monooxygenase auxiliary activity family 9 protein [Thermocrispum agreste]